MKKTHWTSTPSPSVRHLAIKLDDETQCRRPLTDGESEVICHPRGQAIRFRETTRARGPRPGGVRGVSRTRRSVVAVYIVDLGRHCCGAETVRKRTAMASPACRRSRQGIIPCS